jgi:uncharacterized phage protein (TIGR01671 family)
MKREIKFRGIRRDNGEWIYGDLNHLLDGVYISNDHGCNMAQVDPDTVGMNTGLKDKNGKEIYNGDILASDGKPFGHVVDGVRGYCFDVVYFLDIYEGSWPLYGVVVNDHHGDVEIVGNIHDKKKGG